MKPPVLRSYHSLSSHKTVFILKSNGLVLLSEVDSKSFEIFGEKKGKHLYSSGVRKEGF